MYKATEIIDELCSLATFRVQKVWGLFHSIMIFEVFHLKYKKLYLVFDQNPKTFTLHMQDSKPQGLKTISPFILSVKKRAENKLMNMFKNMHEPNSIIINIPNLQTDYLILFNLTNNAYAALFEKNKFIIASTNKAQTETPIIDKPNNLSKSTLQANFLQAEKHQKILLEFHRNFLIQKQNSEKNKAIKKKKALLKNIMSDQNKFEKDSKLDNLATLLKMNFHKLKPGLDEVKLWDYLKDPPEEIIIKLDKKLKPKELLDILFKKIKRANRGLSHTKDRIELVKKELAELQEQDTASIALKDINNLNLSLNSRKKTLAQRLPYKEYLSSDGIKIWVGRSARDSDDLSLHYAKGNEWWFHARDFKGAHVLVKSSDEVLKPNTFHEAAMLAVHFSQAKNEAKALICYTQAKNIKKPKGLPAGRVFLTREKTAEIIMDEQVITNLLKLAH